MVSASGSSGKVDDEIVAFHGDFVGFQEPVGKAMHFPGDAIEFPGVPRTDERSSVQRALRERSTRMRTRSIDGVRATIHQTQRDAVVAVHRLLDHAPALQALKRSNHGARHMNIMSEINPRPHAAGRGVSRSRANSASRRTDLRRLSRPNDFPIAIYVPLLPADPDLRHAVDEWIRSIENELNRRRAIPSNVTPLSIALHRRETASEVPGFRVLWRKGNVAPAIDETRLAARKADTSHSFGEIPIPSVLHRQSHATGTVKIAAFSIDADPAQAFGKIESGSVDERRNNSSGGIDVSVSASIANNAQPLRETCSEVELCRDDDLAVAIAKAHLAVLFDHRQSIKETARKFEIMSFRHYAFPVDKGPASVFAHQGQPFGEVGACLVYERDGDFRQAIKETRLALGLATDEAFRELAAVHGAWRYDDSSSAIDEAGAFRSFDAIAVSRGGV